MQRVRTYRISVEGYGEFDVQEGAKLAYALEQNGVDISHRCGGQARCTTCRVLIEGDQPPMGDAERNSLDEDGVLGQFRLSCQIRIQSDLKLQVLMPVSQAEWSDPGVPLEP